MLKLEIKIIPESGMLKKGREILQGINGLRKEGK